MRDTVELKYKEEDLKMLAGFTLLDDDFMTIVFDRNIEATELVLNIIFGRNDLEVIEVIAQRKYKNPVTGGRSIKLDIYSRDSDGKVYDIEVQNDDAGAANVPCRKDSAGNGNIVWGWFTYYLCEWKL